MSRTFCSILVQASFEALQAVASDILWLVISCMASLRKSLESCKKNEKPIFITEMMLYWLLYGRVRRSLPLHNNQIVDEISLRLQEHWCQAALKPTIQRPYSKPLRQIQWKVLRDCQASSAYYCPMGLVTFTSSVNAFELCFTSENIANLLTLLSTHRHTYTHTHIHHYHHPHVALWAWISLTQSRHPSLSSIASVWS